MRRVAERERRRVAEREGDSERRGRDRRVRGEGRDSESRGVMSGRNSEEGEGSVR